MKIKKMLKCSLAVALIFGSVGALAGCKNDDTTTENLTEQEKIYKLAVDSGYEGTYEQWLATIKGSKGDKGDDGHSPVVYIGNDGYWYIDGVSTNVKATGDSGSKGDDGSTWLSGTTAPNNSNGYDGDFYFDTLAKKIYEKIDGEWDEVVTIVNGSDGNGIAGVTKTTSGNIDSYTINYTDGTSYTFNVQNGINGTNAKDIKLQVANGYIQWAYNVSDPQWENLVDISTLKGDEGDEGKAGKDAKEVTFRVMDGYIQWAYEETTPVWTNLLALGPTWSSGDGVPVFNEANREGDFYFDKVNNDIYIFTDGEWVLQIDMEEKKEDVTTLEDGTYVGALDGCDLVVVLTDGAISSFVYDDEELFGSIGISYELVNGLLKIYAEVEEGNFQDLYFKIGNKVGAGNDEYTQLIYTSYISEEEQAFINGVYGSQYEDDSIITVYKDKVIGIVNGTSFEGNIEYEDVENVFVYAKVVANNLEFNVILNKYTKKFSYNSVEYNFVGEYYSYYEDACVELVKSNDGYVATYNGEPALLNIIEVDNDRMYAVLTVEVDQETVVLDVVFDVKNYSFARAIAPSVVMDSMESNVEYIVSNYYNQENTAGGETNILNIEDEHFYTAIGYVGFDVTEFSIFDVNYINEPTSFSVGNNNFIKMPVWKVENGKLYVASLVLKTYSVGGELEIYVAGEHGDTEAFELKLFDYDSMQATMIPSHSVSVGGTAELTPVEEDDYEYWYDYEEFNYVSDHGHNYIKIYLGSDPKYADASIFTSTVLRRAGSEEAYRSSNGFTKVDEIEGGYYLIYYPWYINGHYSEEDAINYIMDYTVVSSTGEIGVFRFNIDLKAPNN